MKDAYSSSELQRILGVSARSIRRQAIKEAWAYDDRPNLNGGGIQKVFPFATLPSAVKDVIVQIESRSCDATDDEGGDKPIPHEVEAEQSQGDAAETVLDLKGPAIWAKLPEKERQIALARLAVIEAADRWVSKKASDRKKVKALKVFYRNFDAAVRAEPKDSAALLKLGFALDKISRVLDHVKKVNFTTDYRWRSEYEKAEAELGVGLLGLVRTKREAEGLGSKSLAVDIVGYARELILKRHVRMVPISRNKLDGRLVKVNGALLYRRIAAKFGKDKLPTYPHFTRWLNQYLAKEQENLCAVVLPSFWRSSFAPSGGEAGADATYAGQFWEIDGTRADVMLKDGRYEILAGIDIYSRDIVWEVEKNASAVTTVKLFYNGITRWGVPEGIKPDRGTIFLADHVQAACDILHIDLNPCLAYSPNNKPHVERFFGTMSRMLFESMTWYVGHDQKERKRIEEYDKFEQVFYHRRGEKISCDATADELRQVIKDWVEKVYRVEPHNWVDIKRGRANTVIERLSTSPARAQKVADVEALEWMLSPAIERVWDSGVRWLGPDKYMPVDIPSWERVQKYARQKVLFRPLLSDVGRGTIWEVSSNGTVGKLICHVSCQERGGVSLEEYKQAKKSIEKRHRERRKAIESLAGPQSYEAELAEMPMPKVAVGNFGAVEFQNESYEELKGFKFSLMPTRPEGGWLSEEEKGRLAEELAEKEELERANRRTEEPQNIEPQKEENHGQDARATDDGLYVNSIQNDVQNPIRWEDVRGLDEAARYEQVLRGEARGMLIPKDLREDARYFEQTPTFGRLKEYFDEKRALFAAMPWI